MNDPVVKINNKSTNDLFTFTLSNVDVSIANGLRRTILTDIPVIGFDKLQCVIESNTSQFINEILEHRLTCIPVMLDYYKDEKMEDILAKQYIMELDVENTDKEDLIITTSDFILINKETSNKVAKSELEKIFPRNITTGDHITFARLRPRLSDSIPGQYIKLKCGFNVFTAKQDSVYNAVSKCSYYNTIDQKEAKEAWESHKIDFMKQFEEENGSKKDITDELNHEKKNFDALNVYRYFKKNSFEFTLKTASFYTESLLVITACDILIKKLENFINEVFKTPEDLENNNEQTPHPLVEIKLSKDVLQYPSTMENSFDIILHNEDYTLGHILQHIMYETYYIHGKKIIFCGFKKFHPHDSHSVLRIAYIEPVTNEVLNDHLKNATTIGINILRKIQKYFSKH